MDGQRWRIRGRWAGLSLVFALLLGACDGASPDATPVATPLPTHLAYEPAAGVPVAEPAPTEAPTGAPTQPPDTPPTPVPTAVPLPQVCLRPEFADLVDPAGCTHYDITLAIDADAATVTGHEVIAYTNTESEPLDTLALRLFPNAPHYGGTLVVADLRVRGEPVEGTLEQEESALRIPLAAPIRAGESVTVSVDFEVGVPRSRDAGYGLFSYVDGVMALPNVYPVIPVYDADGWAVDLAPAYGDDPYTDVAAYAVQVTAPPEMVLIASGTCTETEAEAGTWTCEAAPMRDFTLVLGERYERFAERVEGVVVNSYYYDGAEWSGQKALDVAAGAVRAFTEFFGPYPYTELDVVETPSLLGGMEYPGLVVVKDAYYRGNPTLEWIVAHEVAHQWWYAVVGSDPVNDPWLDESLTSYSTMLYYEHAYGRARAESILEGEFRQTYRGLVNRGQDMRVDLPAEDYGSSLYWDVIYRKGPLYFAELRAEVGDDAFFEILQTYYEMHRFHIATPVSWLRAVETVTGSRHLDLYDRWIGR